MDIKCNCGGKFKPNGHLNYTGGAYRTYECDRCQIKIGIPEKIHMFIYPTDDLVIALGNPSKKYCAVCGSADLTHSVYCSQCHKHY